MGTVKHSERVHVSVGRAWEREDMGMEYGSTCTNMGCFEREKWRAFDDVASSYSQLKSSPCSLYFFYYSQNIPCCIDGWVDRITLLVNSLPFGISLVYDLEDMFVNENTFTCSKKLYVSKKGMRMKYEVKRH